MMIYRTLPVLILTFCFISPVHADYLKMNQEIKHYTPPAFFVPSSEDAKKSADKERDTDAEKETAAVIAKLKSGFEKRIKDRRAIDFLPYPDNPLLSSLSGSAKHLQKTKDILAKAVKLEEIEVLAALRNPAIHAAQNDVLAELQSFNQVLGLDENFKQYAAFTSSLNNKIGPLKMKDSIKQKYPFPGLTSLNGRIVQQQVEVAVEKMNITQKTIITQTRKAYWDLVFTERSVGITIETINTLNRLKDVATALYKSGRTSFQDIIKININIEVLKEDLNTLSSQKSNIHAKLKELLNLPVDAALGRVVKVGPYKDVDPLETLYSLAGQNSQELKIIRFRIAKMENMIEVAESMILSESNLNLSAFENDAVNSVGFGAPKTPFPEKNMAGMKNGTPIKPWYGIDNPWLNQTRQNLLSLKKMLIKQENETDRMVRDAWFMVDKNMRELSLFNEKVLPLTRSALDVATREYESGAIPFSQAIGSYTDWLKTRLTIAKKQSGLGTAIANLEKTIGTSF